MPDRRVDTHTTRTYTIELDGCTGHKMVLERIQRPSPLVDTFTISRFYPHLNTLESLNTVELTALRDLINHALTQE